MHPDVAEFARRSGCQITSPEEITAKLAEYRQAFPEPAHEIGYREEAYRQLHESAVKLAKLLARVQRSLVIDGKFYVVSPDADDPERTQVRKLYGSTAEPYTVEGKRGDDSLTYGPNAGYSCDCPDFAHRHAGTGSHGCKHIVSLSTFGMLPRLAERAELTSHDYAEIRGERQYEESRA